MACRRRLADCFHADGGSCAVQYERHVDMRPQYFLGHAQPQPEQTTAQKAAAKSVTTDNGSGSVGAVDGLKDVVVSHPPDNHWRLLQAPHGLQVSTAAPVLPTC